MFSVFCVGAQSVTSGTTGDCTWTLDGSKLTISGQGKMGSNNNLSTTAAWPKDITEVVIEDGVTEIGAGAFSYCQNIESLIIPKSVKSIGSYAFENSKISNLYIEDLISWCGVKVSTNYFTDTDNAINTAENVYINGELTTELILPDTVTEISDYAFYGFKNLKTVIMSDSIEKIGKSAFEKCLKLTDVYVSKKLRTVGDSAFYFCESIENVYITDLAAWCQINFYYKPYWYDGDMETLDGGYIYSNPIIYCKNLILNNEIVTELVVPEGLESIGSGIFCGYEKLKKVVFPKSLKTIGDASFKNCTKLTEVIMGNNVTYIGEAAFYNCSSLANIQLSGVLKTVGMYAFLGDESLENVYYSGSIDDKGKIKHLDVGSYDYDIYKGYKYLNDAVWYYNTCYKHEWSENGVCSVCGNSDSITLKKVNKYWRLYKNGKTSEETTLIKFNGKWFYIEKGVWNKNIDTIVKYRGKWFYVQNGKWNSSVKGLKYYKGKYFYIKNGKWDKTKTGFVTYRGEKCYVKNGKWVEKTQILNYKGKNYFLKNGKQTTYTGITRINGKWYYIKNGKWSKKKTIVRYVPNRVKIKEGVYVYSYNLVGYKGELFYVNNGYAQLDYTGKVKVDGKIYKIKKGIVV